MKSSADALANDIIDWRFKGIGDALQGTSFEDVGQCKAKLFTGEFWTPVLVIRESALAWNLERMAQYCTAKGVDLAPHGKTTMSPELIQRQLDHGAWAITAANVSQARMMLHFGVKRILLANELLDPSAVDWVARQLDGDEALEFLCYVDSIAGIELMRDALGARASVRPLKVLVECGELGGRAGCRTTEEAIAVAISVARCPGMTLAGVAGFEGVLRGTDVSDTLRRVDAFLSRMREVTLELIAAELFNDAAEIVVTAGGSAYFDRVTSVLGGAWPGERPVRVVLRSGCYLTHDSGSYKEFSPFGNGREDGPDFRAALQLWCRVLSRPEPNLAIADFGKRDASTDGHLPVPEVVWHHQTGVRKPAGDIRVVAVNDQHAYISLSDPESLGVGDLLGCGISHPCTSFDKWRAIPVVDDDLMVIGVVHTYF